MKKDRIKGAKKAARESINEWLTGPAPRAILAGEPLTIHFADYPGCCMTDDGSR